MVLVAVFWGYQVPSFYHCYIFIVIKHINTKQMRPYHEEHRRERSEHGLHEF